MTTKFTKADIGKRVILAAQPDLGMGEERGELVLPDRGNEVAIVRLDEQYRSDHPEDDCLREVPIEFVELEKPN